MSAITNEFLIERLQGQFGDKILSVGTPYDLVTVEVPAMSINEILHGIHEDKILKFRFLTDICGSHFPDLNGKELCVIYHVHSLENNIRLRIKCFLPIENPLIPSVSKLYSSANWMERETYDFYGIQFTDHPNLVRILNADEMDYFPLRKEYPLEDATRQDKEDEYFGR